MNDDTMEDAVFDHCFDGERLPTNGAQGFWITCSLCHASVEQNHRRDHAHYHAKRLSTADIIDVVGR